MESNADENILSSVNGRHNFLKRRIHNVNALIVRIRRLPVSTVSRTESDEAISSAGYRRRNGSDAIVMFTQKLFLPDLHGMPWSQVNVLSAELHPTRCSQKRTAVIFYDIYIAWSRCLYLWRRRQQLHLTGQSLSHNSIAIHRVSS